MSPHDSSKAGVVLLHGHAATGHLMGYLARRLRREGHAVWTPSYATRRASLARIVERLSSRIRAFEEEVEGPLHFVTHSLGCLVAQHLIAQHRPAQLGRVVMLAPPQQGSEWADLAMRMRIDRLVLGPVAADLCTPALDCRSSPREPVDYELGVIAGSRPLEPLLPRLIVRAPSDGKVRIEATRVSGMRAHLILPTSHSLMVFDRRVADEVIAFLRAGHFTGASLQPRSAAAAAAGTPHARRASWRQHR